MPGTQQQYQVTLIVDNRSFGIFDTLSGGAVTAEETKHRPGGMRPQRAYGGPVSVSNVVVSRVYDEADVENARYLQNRVGKARCTVLRQPLDADGNTFGRGTTYSGILNGVTLGDIDSNSSDTDMWEVEISTEGNIG